jgi:hypothetical protein
MFDIKGSVEHKSIHGLAYAIIWVRVSPGVKGVSAGVRGGIIGAGGMYLSEDSTTGIWERWDETSVRTREWKCGLVIGLVSMSYYESQPLFPV